MKHFTKLTLTAIALGAGMSAMAAVSVPQRLGEKNPLQPPFCETFDDFRAGMEHDDFDRYFQTIDANNDGRVWGLYNYSDGGRLSKCAYLHSPIGKPMDDWLIPRAIRLQAGKFYCVSMDASLYSEGSQTFEVKYGMYNDAEGLDMPVIPATTVTWLDRSRVEGWICPDMTGIYYIGVHGITGTNGSSYLFIDNISVAAPVESGAPGAVTDVKAVNDPKGSGSLTLTFNAPAVDMDGKALTENCTVTVTRGDFTVATLRNLTPGQKCEVVDRSSVRGEVTYVFTPSNSDGSGRPVHQSVFKGLGAPVAPVITAFEELPDNQARLSWTVPATDVYGSAIDPSLLRFVIREESEENGVSEIDTVDGSISEYVYDLLTSDGEQMLILASVTAMMDTVASAPAVSNYLNIGTPYPVPHHNSFTLDDYYSYIMEIVGGDSDLTWRMLDDHSDPHAQDGDNGYVSLIGSQPGQECELRSGKLDFTSTTSPAVSFWTYVYSEDQNLIELWTYDVAAGTSAKAATVNLSGCTRVGWQRFFVPIPDCAGKVARIGFKGIVVTHGYIPVDNVTVAEMSKVDLYAGNVEAPTFARVDEPFTVIATVGNNGSAAVSDAVAVLLRDGMEVATAKVPSINPGGEVKVELSDVFSAITSDMPNMQVRVDAPGDGNTDDNLSYTFVVTFVGPNHPAVTDLNGDFSGTTVNLTWSKPDLSLVAPDEVTEGFEQCKSLQTQIPGWEMVDLDQGYVGGFQGVEMPGIDRTQQAFWVMDSETYPFIDPYTGSKLLVAMYGTNQKGTQSVRNDDWLISPELYGGRQSISFMASSVNDNYGYETFRVYWSDGSLDTDDFIPLTDADIEAPVAWTRFFFTLPAGARRFAVRYTSENVYMLMLDDFSYIPEGKGNDLTLLGYNVYRNSVKLNSAPIAETSYSVARGADSDRFCVTAVYDAGESVASNIVSANSAISGVEADSDAPVEFFNLKGIRVSAPLAPGVYVRRQGSRATKVLIR